MLPAALWRGSPCPQRFAPTDPTHARLQHLRHSVSTRPNQQCHNRHRASFQASAAPTTEKASHSHAQQNENIASQPDAAATPDQYGNTPAHDSLAGKIFTVFRWPAALTAQTVSVTGMQGRQPVLQCSAWLQLTVQPVAGLPKTTVSGLEPEPLSLQPALPSQ